MTRLSACLREFRSVFITGKAAQATIAGIADVETHAFTPIPLYHLARIAEFYGRWELWKQTIMLAFSLEHRTPQSVYLRACAKRRLGDWSGWSDNEARHLAPWAPSFEPLFARRLHWNTPVCRSIADLRDKVLLVVDEGGYGDSFQSLCFIPPLAAAAKRVIFATKPELGEFVAHNFGAIANVVTSTEQLDDEVDEWIFSWSVPTMFDGIPAFEQLTPADPIPRARFDDQTLQVGLCWAASDYNLPPGGDRRSIHDFSVLEPLLSAPSIHWHSLQVGHGVRAADPYPAIRTSDPPLATFSAEANLLAALDCVVTVDTAVVHLAGRMGVPTIVLLRCSSDDRWGLGDSTPWYPRTHLFRQPGPGDWTSVVAMASRRLREISSSLMASAT
jgi:hypothetical protein